MEGSNVKNQCASGNEDAASADRDAAERNPNRSVSALDSLLGCNSSTDSDSETNEQDAHNQAITNEERVLYLNRNSAY